MLTERPVNGQISEESRQLIGEVSGNFTIIASKFNPKLVDGLLGHCLSILDSFSQRSTSVIRVPGAFEIPAIAARCADDNPTPDAIICLGAVIQGETTHAEQITLGVTNALAQLQISYKIPIIHGVGHYQTLEQAEKRCLYSDHNRGSECALVALEMAHLFSQIRTL